MNHPRRKFVVQAGAVPLAMLLAQTRAWSAEMPRVNPDRVNPDRVNPDRVKPDSETAKSLNYTHASTDPAKRCANCQFYTDPSRADWGPCVIFPGELVNANGLCNSYFKRAG